MSAMRSDVHQCLSKVVKGWFNLGEDNWEVYQSSKLKKLMELTKFAMQVCMQRICELSLLIFLIFFSSGFLEVIGT